MILAVLGQDLFEVGPGDLQQLVALAEILFDLNDLELCIGQLVLQLCKVLYGGRLSQFGGRALSGLAGGGGLCLSGGPLGLEGVQGGPGGQIGRAVQQE